jgi:hypothetical protein
MHLFYAEAGAAPFQKKDPWLGRKRMACGSWLAEKRAAQKLKE